MTGIIRKKKAGKRKMFFNILKFQHKHDDDDNNKREKKNVQY